MSVLNRDNSSQMCLEADDKPEPLYNGAILHVVDAGEWYRYYTANWGNDAYSPAKWFIQ